MACNPTVQYDDFTGDGVTTAYTITFPYDVNSKTDVQVRLGTYPNFTYPAYTTDYSVDSANPNVVNFVTAPSGPIRIFRCTPNNVLPATFQAGSAIRSSDLNNNFEQLLHVTQDSSIRTVDTEAIAASAFTKSTNALASATTAIGLATTADANASTAISQVNNLIPYTAVATVSDLQFVTPFTGDRFEVTNSTGAESSSLIVNLPTDSNGNTTFVGSADIKLRLEHNGTAFSFIDYIVPDPDSRYLTANTSYVESVNGATGAVTFNYVSSVNGSSGAVTIDPSTNTFSNTAPATPDTGDFWTDTTTNPPILKSWDGTAWVEISTSASALSVPVISNVTLTDDSPGGNRFTSSTFSVDATMVDNGTPVSQKGVKATVTANFVNYASLPALTGNTVTNASTSYSGFTTYNAQVLSTATNVNYGNRTLVTPAYKSNGWYFVYSSNYSSSGETGIFFKNDASSSGIGANIHNGTAQGSNFTDIIGIGHYKGTYWTVSANSRPKLVAWSDGSTSCFEHATSSGYNDPGGAFTSDGEVLYYITGVNSTQGLELQILNKDLTSTSPINSFDSFVSGTLTVDFLTSFSSYNAEQANIAYDEVSDKIIITGEKASTTATVTFDIDRTVGISLNRLTNKQEVTTDSTDVSALVSDGAYGVYRYNQNRSLQKWNHTTNSWDTKWLSPTYQQFQNLPYIRDGYMIGCFRDASNHFNIVQSQDSGSSWSVMVSNVHQGSTGDDTWYAALGFGQLVTSGYRSSGSPYMYTTRFRQQITQAATTTAGALSTWGEREPIALSGHEDDQTKWGNISNLNSANGTFNINSNYSFSTGDVIVSRSQSTSSSSSTRYLVINSVGQVTDIASTDPGFIQQGPGLSHDLTFPATFPSGNSPDFELPVGTVLQAEIQATNSSGSDSYTSNSITPS